jgi:hypothetical protein
MPKQNFKSHEKRKRELAKLDKRQAKDQKRALKRTEGSEPVATLSSAPSAVLPARVVAGVVAPPAPPAAKPPLTLAEAVERWKNTKLVKPKRR